MVNMHVLISYGVYEFDIISYEATLVSTHKSFSLVNFKIFLHNYYINSWVASIYMSCVMRKPFFLYTCENKGADQLSGNPEADQCLCFRDYKDSTISTEYSLNLKFLDQLANLHFHFTSVPRCTPMTFKPFSAMDQVKNPENWFSHNEAHITLG